MSGGWKAKPVWSELPDEYWHVVDGYAGRTMTRGINKRSALLIAAAPDMLAALKDIRENWLHHPCQVLDEAIEKAEGKS